MLRVIARMNVGGPALQVVGLTKGLDPARFEQRLLVGEVGPDEADYLELRASEIRPVRVGGLGRTPNALGDVRALATVTRQVRAFRPDVVHTHTAKAGVIGRLASLASPSTAVVHTFHGHLLHGYFSPTVTRAVIATERALARRSRILVAVGTQVRDDLLEAGIGRPSQYRVVPPGVQLPAAPTRANARAALRLPDDAVVVAFVARLTAVKRPDRFLEAARLVASRHPEVVFAVAGEGALLDELRAGAASLGDRFRFLGWRPDVETVYAASDLVALTSDNEGMPVSLIEAATVGCAAVTTDVGSAREVVLDGETGLVVPTDAEAIAEAISALVADPARRESMATASRAHAARQFSRQRLVDDMAAIYDEVTDSRR